MKKFLFPAAVIAASLLLNGCLVKPVSESGGAGAITITNTNPNAIISAAQTVFPQYGYTMGPMMYPASVSFDKPAGKFGNLMYGSYGVTTTIRARLTITQLPGTNNYRLSVRPMIVNDAGEAGFESKHNMAGFWSGQFGPILKQIQTQATNAGSGY